MHILDDKIEVQPAEDAPARRTYTDGSHTTAAPNMPAGWATITFALQHLATGTTEELIHASCGRVTTMPGDETYDGATRHTNNTAELTALLRAVQDELRVDDGAVVELCVDSTYAQGVALGRWQTKKNRELARRLRLGFTRLREQRNGNACIRHVRSHARVAGNETADHLAKLAAGDAALAGNNETVTSVARSEYARIVGDDARNMTTDAAHDSANHSDPATTSTFQRPVAAHALGVG